MNDEEVEDVKLIFSVLAFFYCKKHTCMKNNMEVRTFDKLSTKDRRF